MQQLASIFLSLLLLTNLVGMPVARHVCGGKVQSVNIAGLQESCEMHRAEKAAPCAHHAKPACHAAQEEAPKKGCCKDEVEVLAQAQDLFPAQAQVEMPVLAALPIALPDFTAAFSVKPLFTTPHLFDLPPPPTARYLLLQVFRL